MKNIFNNILLINMYVCLNLFYAYLFYLFYCILFYLFYLSLFYFFYSYLVIFPLIYFHSFIGQFSENQIRSSEASHQPLQDTRI